MGIFGLGAVLLSNQPLAAWPILIPPALYLSSGLRQAEQFGERWSHLTTIVVAYAFVCSVATLAAQFRTTSNLFIGNPSEAVVFALPTIVILTSYYLSRETNLARAQAASFFGISKTLAPTDGEESIWPELARHIRRSLGYEAVYIVVPEGSVGDHGAGSLSGAAGDEYLRVVGAAGPHAEAGFGLRYRNNIGMSGEALFTRRVVIWNDVGAHDDYVRVPGSRTKSELLAPVFDLDRPDQPLALISIHNSRRNAFTHARDEPAVQQFCDYIQMCLRSSRYVLRFHRQLLEELEGVANTTSWTELVEGLLASTKILFRPNFVAFVELGLGTGRPLRIWADEVDDDSTSRLLLGTRSEADAVSMALNNWRTVQFRVGDSISPSSDSRWQDWAFAHNIDQGAITPVGPANQKLGLLVVGTVRGVDYEWSLLLQSLVDAFSAKLLAAQYVDGLFHHFARPRIDLHRFMSEADLSRGKVESQLAKTEKTNPELANVLNGIRMVVNRFYAADATRPPDFASRSFASVIDDLNSSDLIKRYEFHRIQPRIDSLVEAESPWLKLILFRFITEATVNALAHGGATRVGVRVFRLREAVEVVIRDNGDGFQPSETADGEDHDPGGVFGVGAYLSKLCGADPIDWHWTAPGKGTVLSVRIPVRQQSLAPLRRPSEDKMDRLDNEEEAFL